MDILSIIDRLVATMGFAIDAMTAMAWLAVFYSWHEQKQYRLACHVASDRGVAMPEPNPWVLYARPLWFLACTLLWLSMIHWGQLQQKPIRG